MDNKHRMRCKNCGSTLVYARLKTKEIVCRSCGSIDKFNTVEETEKEVERNGNSN